LEKENIYLQISNLKLTCLPVLFQEDSEVPKVQKADFTKKKKKRILEIFLEKENIYLKFQT